MPDDARQRFHVHLCKLITGAMRECQRAHGEIDPGSVAKRVASQLWAETSPTGHHDLPAFVRHVRGQLGLTQEEFAARLGVRRLAVTRWEAGAAVPRPTMQTRMVELARRSIDAGHNAVI